MVCIENSCYNLPIIISRLPINKTVNTENSIYETGSPTCNFKKSKATLSQLNRLLRRVV